jgi:outer membrane biosynthesis protein TonB
MKVAERRQTPRTKIERHAYINIEPNNGGIVLNVSSGGLCFHSFDPVKRNGPISFWFSDHNRRIEAVGELAWMDETQKGGLRFTALPPEAREQIHNWMNPAMPAAEGVSTPPMPPRRAFPGPSAGPTDTNAAPVGYAPAAVVPPEARVAVPLSGFSGGLATGLLIAAVVAAAFLFQNYRREVGESLIRLGERFGGKPQEQAQAMSPAVQSVVPAPQTVSPAPQIVLPAPRPLASPAPQTVSPSRPTPSPAAQIKAPTPAVPPVSQPEKLPPQPLAIPAKLQQAKVEPAPVTATPSIAPTAASNPAPKAPAATNTPAVSSAPPTVSLPATGVGPVSNLLAAKLGTVPPLAPASRPGVQAEDSGTANSVGTEEMYFEIGKFKDEGQANSTTDKLAQLGFPATAVQKGHLWRNSYHVLVGPYQNEDKAKATHGELVSHGFKPRPFEKGSRSFSFRSGVTLNGAQTPEGDYTIRWESYVTDATVKFLHNDFVVATADGRWEKRDVKYPRDAYVYKKNVDGSRTLLEIHFGGMRQALVFGKAS